MALPDHRVAKLKHLLERARKNLAQSLSVDDRMRWQREIAALADLLKASGCDCPLENRLSRFEGPPLKP